MERTCVIIKPDGVKRKLIGKIINRIEEKGWEVTSMKMGMLEEEVLKEHYIHHADKPFYNDLVHSMMTGPVVMMIVEGMT